MVQRIEMTIGVLCFIIMCLGYLGFPNAGHRWMEIVFAAALLVGIVNATFSVLFWIWS